jgi:hypothetical protein
MNKKKFSLKIHECIFNCFCILDIKYFKTIFLTLPLKAIILLKNYGNLNNNLKIMLSILF